MWRILVGVPMAFVMVVPVLAAPLSAGGNGSDRYLQSLTEGAPRAPEPAPSSNAAADGLAKTLGQRFGVDVLRVEPGESDGRPIYRMVVMNLGGDFNSAFAVHTLVVDAETGALVPQFRHEPSGYQLAAQPDRTPRDNGVATTIRRESFSKP